jgi:hypothetical protein
MSPHEVETAPVRSGLSVTDVPRQAFQLAGQPCDKLTVLKPAHADERATPCSRFARCSPLP